MTKPQIKINFTDFWPGFIKEDNYFFNLLQPHYAVEISDDPDFLIYSTFGENYKKYRCIRIFFTGENARPNFSQCDYAFTLGYLVPRDYSRPRLYVVVCNLGALLKDNINVEEVIREETKFCNFIYSNSNSPVRNKFFEKLSQYKRVDSGGRHLNNIGGPIPVGQKSDFLRQYKFTIAFENTEYPGYTTEKIFEPMLVNSIPLYWGNELVQRDFNPKSFLSYYDFGSEEEFIEKIIEVDRNDELYEEYLKQHCFHDNKLNRFVEPQNVLKQFEYIFSNPKAPVAQKNSKVFFFFHTLSQKVSHVFNK